MRSAEEEEPAGDNYQNTKSAVEFPGILRMMSLWDLPSTQPVSESSDDDQHH